MVQALEARNYLTEGHTDRAQFLANLLAEKIKDAGS